MSFDCLNGVPSSLPFDPFFVQLTFLLQVTFLLRGHNTDINHLTISKNIAGYTEREKKINLTNHPSIQLIHGMKRLGHYISEDKEKFFLNQKMKL